MEQINLALSVNALLILAILFILYGVQEEIKGIEIRIEKLEEHNRKMEGGK